MHSPKTTLYILLSGIFEVEEDDLLANSSKSGKKLEIALNEQELYTLYDQVVKMFEQAEVTLLCQPHVQLLLYFLGVTKRR
jgi:hypothetical protein